MCYLKPCHYLVVIVPVLLLQILSVLAVAEYINCIAVNHLFVDGPLRCFQVYSGRTVSLLNYLIICKEAVSKGYGHIKGPTHKHWQCVVSLFLYHFQQAVLLFLILSK